MAWQHVLARELKARNNRPRPAWFRGEVISPIRKVDELGRVTYEGPLIISCYDGQVMLRAGQLKQLAGIAADAGIERLYQGHSVALTGDVFAGQPGSLQILILGVIEDAV